MERDAFAVLMAQTFATGLKLKVIMLERGLTRVNAKCPRCKVDKALQGALVDRKKHMRMWCKTPGCGMQMME